METREFAVSLNWNARLLSVIDIDDTGTHPVPDSEPNHYRRSAGGSEFTLPFRAALIKSVSCRFRQRTFDLTGVISLAIKGCDDRPLARQRARTSPAETRVPRRLFFDPCRKAYPGFEARPRREAALPAIKDNPAASRLDGRFAVRCTAGLGKRTTASLAVPARSMLAPPPRRPDGRTAAIPGKNRKR